MTRTLFIAGVLITAIAGAWWIAHDNASVETQSTAQSDSAPTARTESIPTVPVEAKPSTVAYANPDVALTGFTADKYRLLTNDLFRHSNPGDELQATLLERERIAVDLNTARQSRDERQRGGIRQYEMQLAEADARIRALLHPTDYAVFETLKDSDIEQFQLDEYAAGISNVAPLSADDRRAILLTKLNYKRTFRQILLDSGLLRDDLSPAARSAAFDGVGRALSQYRDSYLAEVRQYLFDAELAKLRSMAGG